MVSPWVYDGRSCGIESIVLSRPPIARLGGYLDHRRNTPIGIQVLWRGWAKLQDLVEGWQLAQKT
ncbi:MAG: hypothetical protein F6K09_03615 [Merismopedia sp. SIO2A8]|nr:hypothetical protein [Merismopedia sp. SIO2A8]